MKYIIGMDGGGTKTKCVVADFDLNLKFECTGGPSNFLMQGTEKVSETLLKLIDECRENLKAEYSDFAAVLIGTTGAGRRTDAEKLENDFVDHISKKGVKLNLFRVESDARIALEGAFAGKPGSILIAGTGSIMFGKDREGNIQRVGGFGRFIGDEGSGFVIGKKGLIAASKEYDGRGLKTQITKMIADEFGISDTSALITEIYKNNFDIASVAPLVIKAAEHEDELCLNILDEETEELILHIRAMKKHLKEENMRLSLIGGTITTDNFYAKIFKDKIKRHLPNVILQQPEYPPAMGAVLMAKEHLNSK